VSGQASGAEAERSGAGGSGLRRQAGTGSARRPDRRGPP